MVDIIKQKPTDSILVDKKNSKVSTNRTLRLEDGEAIIITSLVLVKDCGEIKIFNIKEVRK